MNSKEMKKKSIKGEATFEARKFQCPRLRKCQTPIRKSWHNNEKIIQSKATTDPKKLFMKVRTK